MSLAEILSNPKLVVIVTVVSGLVVILASLTGGMRKVAGWIRTRILKVLLRRRPTLVVVPQLVVANRNMWSQGAVGAEEAIQANSEFTITNVSVPPRVVLISDVRVRIRGVRGRYRVHRPMPLLGLRGSANEIPPGISTSLSILFFITPRVVQPPKRLLADIGLVDQFGETHWVRKVDHECAPSLLGRVV